jgi:capsular polysaccharide transport system permease protein
MRSKARPDLVGSLRVQARIIGALMVREAMSRYGHESLGFFWLMGEPLLLTCGVTVLWTLTGQTHGFGIDVIPFALSGYTMITLWRSLVFRSLHAMRQNVGLVFHSNVKFFDILAARALLDTIGILTAFFIAYVPLTALGFMEPMYDPMLLFGAWFLTAWFSFGVALILAGISELSEAAERFVHPIMYITIPVTGTFYMVYWLPEKVRDIALWSPLVHGSEMFRAGLFRPDVPTQWDAMYLLWWCMALTAIGLPITFYAQRHVRLE